jgi:hypothetical protein
MLAPPDSTPETMLRALATTIGALDAASELDVDRTDEDRAFFAAEKAAMQPLFDELFTADLNVTRHTLLTSMRLQARIEIGDVVLDRGVRAGKKRAALELKPIDADAVDHVFPSDIRDIVDAKRQVEPALVLGVTGRFKDIPDFPGKDAVKADLEGRANRQAQNFTDRTAGELVEDGLDSAVERLVTRAADKLYELEKRLLGRFKREAVYVRAFFLDVAPPRKRPAKTPGNEGNKGDGGEGSPQPA